METQEIESERGDMGRGEGGVEEGGREGGREGGGVGGGGGQMASGVENCDSSRRRIAPGSEGRALGGTWGSDRTPQECRGSV